MDKKTTKVATGNKQPIKLAKATVNPVVMDDKSVLFTGYVLDEMQIPTDYQKLVKMCRFFYMHDPIAGTVMNKIVDCAITPLTNRKANCSDEEYAVYNSILDLLQEFFRNVCLEYLLSGLVVPQYEWARTRGSDLSPTL